jgi:hypothetical protein
MSVRRTAVLTLASPALIAAALTAPANAAPSTPGDEVVTPPAAGTCWDYTYEQAARKQYTGTPVDCAEPHTVETVITLDVPSGVAAKGNSSPELVLWMDQRCQPAINRYAGVATPDTAAPGTRTWSLWYTPTKKQWEAGNHWISCAAGSVPRKQPDDSESPKRLVPVSGSIAQAARLSKTITFKTTYGTGRYLARKPMTDLADQPWPGSSGLQKKAGNFCERALGHTKFFWYGPNDLAWEAGYTAVRCYSLKKK